MAGYQRVWRTDNRLEFQERIDWAASIDFMKKVYNSINNRGYEDIVIDLSKVKRAYPNGVVPIIAEIDTYRKAGVDFTVIPPSDTEIESLFSVNSWLHHIEPRKFDEFEASNTSSHLSLQKFEDDTKLNELVNCAVEICLQQLVFAKGVPQAFEWVINELAGNVLVHAGSSPGWIQVTTFKDSHRLAFVVCDSGLGIPETLSKTYDFRNDIDALELAIKKGVTSKPDFGQGNGLAGAIAIAQTSQGLLALTSGRGRLRVLEGNVEPKKNFPPLMGTCVEMQFDTDKEIDLPKALWGYEPVDYFETKYEDENLEESVFRLREYASSFGNRITGERIRTLVDNLVKQNHGRPVKIDMDDVSVISSSFADELFGKLFLELGSVDFSRIIKFENMNPTCKSIIDHAVAQRVSQSFFAQQSIE